MKSSTASHSFDLTLIVLETLWRSHGAVHRSGTLPASTQFCWVRQTCSNCVQAFSPSLVLADSRVSMQKEIMLSVPFALQKLFSTARGLCFLKKMYGASNSLACTLRMYRLAWWK